MKKTKKMRRRRQFLSCSSVLNLFICVFKLSFPSMDRCSQEKERKKEGRNEFLTGLSFSPNLYSSICLESICASLCIFLSFFLCKKDLAFICVCVCMSCLRSLAPALFGMEEVKRACACLLFGGTQKQIPDGSRLRGYEATKNETKKQRKKEQGKKEREKEQGKKEGNKEGRNIATTTATQLSLSLYAFSSFSLRSFSFVLSLSKWLDI